MSQGDAKAEGGTVLSPLPLNLHKLKIKCPKCHKKGIGFDDHPHAFGWKDYDYVRCRYCRSRWKAEKFAAWYIAQKETDSEEEAEPQDTRTEE